LNGVNNRKTMKQTERCEERNGGLAFGRTNQRNYGRRDVSDSEEFLKKRNPISETFVKRARLNGVERERDRYSVDS